MTKQDFKDMFKLLGIFFGAFIAVAMLIGFLWLCDSLGCRM